MRSRCGSRLWFGVGNKVLFIVRVQVSVVVKVGLWVRIRIRVNVLFERGGKVGVWDVVKVGFGVMARLEDLRRDENIY